MPVRAGDLILSTLAPRGRVKSGAPVALGGMDHEPIHERIDDGATLIQVQLGPAPPQGIALASNRTERALVIGALQAIPLRGESAFDLFASDEPLRERDLLAGVGARELLELGSSALSELKRSAERSRGLSVRLSASARAGVSRRNSTASVTNSSSGSPTMLTPPQPRSPFPAPQTYVR